MSAPISARTNTSAAAAAVNMMPGGVPRRGPPQNPLLVRDDVGKAKASCYDLPDDRFAYGRPGNHDQEGAREVSMYWVSHKPSPTPECAAPDFVWFNKRAASARVTTARDLAFYRKENDNFTPRYGVPTPRSARESVDKSDTLTKFTYGKKVRPSTPIDEVISHRFAERAEDELRKFYTDYRDEQEKGSSQVRKIHLTNAAQGHASNAKKVYHQEEAREEHFKMKKYRQITGKVDSGQNGGRRLSANAILAQLSSAKQSARGESRCSQEASEAGVPDREEAFLGADDTV